MLFRSKKDGTFGANLVMPVVIRDEFFPRMNKLMDEFNVLDPEFSLSIDKNSGSMVMHVTVPSETMKTLTEDGRIAILHRLFGKTDQVFPETMLMMYGGRLPEVSIMKLVGLRTSQLN